jgi:hypothetical protein
MEQIMSSISWADPGMNYAKLKTAKVGTWADYRFRSQM